MQSAVVLGGTSEIAMATVRLLMAGRLRRVTLVARDLGRAQHSARELRASGAHVEVIAFDASEPATHEGVVADAFRRTGEVDMVLVAHGVLGPGPDVQLDAALDVLQTNFVGAVSAMIPAARELVRQGHGTLVVITSVAGERARASNFVYGSSKAGLDAFAQGLGDSLAGTGVRVLVVRPGFVRTRMTSDLDAAPLAVDAADVAQAIVAGLRRDAHTVWVPPVMRWVMLVLRMLPRAIFRRLPI